jgi:AcrR family transcriptional regulator
MRSTSSRRRALPKDDAGTRERLLEAAVRVFADRGFQAATVREICRRAGANVAAVNYHFGSKEELEIEAARHCAIRMREQSGTPAPADAAPPADLPGAIATIASCILVPHEEWQTRLMLRAMAESRPSLDTVVREFIEPRVRALEAAMEPYLPGADARTLRLHALSIVSQFVYHRIAGPVALRLLGERDYTQALREEIVAHVTRFAVRSLAAARREAKGEEGNGARKDGRR